MSARLLVCTIAVLAAGRAFAQAPDAGDGGWGDAGADASRDAGAVGDAGPHPNPLPKTGEGTGADAGSGSDAGSQAAPAGPLPVALRGTVLARGGHRRIKGATIFVDGVPVADTDDNGEFVVMAAPGRHNVQAAASRYTAAGVSVNASASGWTGEIRLAPGGQVFETVVAAKPVTPVVRVEGEAARTTPGTGGDPFRVIESLPGVSQIVWPFALYAIRGANPGNTGFFLDGMRVPALFHFALGPSIIHPYLIDKLSFYPGGYPARLGGYVSGAVAAETAAPPNDIARYTADVRLYDAGGLVTAPWDGGRGTVAVAARYAYTGLIVSRLFGDVDFGYADYQVRADHTFGGGRATLFALGSFDHLNIKDQQIGEAALNFHRLDLRWDRRVGPLQMQARTAFSTDDAKSQLYDSPIGVRSYGVAPRLSFLSGMGGATLEFGVDGEAQRFSTDLAFASVGGMRPTPPALLADLARTRNALSLRAFAAAVIALGRLKLEPGLRYAQYFEQGVTRGAFEPRLTARVLLTRALSVDATVGRFSQMPSLPVGVAGFEGFGLRDLGLQTSTQAALGVETSQLPGDATLRLTGFYQWLFVSDMRSTFNHDVTAPEFLEMRRGRGYGGEVMLRLPERARVSGWLAYTLSWSLREFDGVFAASDWDQRHILNLVGTIKLKDGFSVGGRFHFNSGRPYPVQAAEYERLPAFWQIDLRADKRVVFDRATFDFYLDLGNVTFNRQVTALGAVDDLNAPKQQAGFRIVLPSIGVHAEW